MKHLKIATMILVAAVLGFGASSMLAPSPNASGAPSSSWRNGYQVGVMSALQSATQTTHETPALWCELVWLDKIGISKTRAEDQSQWMAGCVLGDSGK